ncbi:hypothetical protein HYU14_02020 [Candidatus Woesearchaeota archaeon]|nr:hypothetical protein [Candidatus Woesearchaeota archaeon]
MPSGEVKGVFQRLHQLKAEVSLLQQKLGAAHAEKESCFSKKRELSSKARELISQLKECRKKRDAVNAAIQDEKRQRNSLHSDVKQDATQLQGLNEQKAGVAKGIPPNASPARLKAMMERIETTIETEVLAFEKEKQLMKKIKQLKAQYKDAEELSGVSSEIREKSRGLQEKRREANSIHRQIQGQAKESQLLHEQVITLSKAIDAAEAEEEAALHAFVVKKQAFQEIGKKLREKLLELRELGQVADKAAEERKHERDSQEIAFLKSREATVEEKIKKRQKLTVDDILLYQQLAEKEEKR